MAENIKSVSELKDFDFFIPNYQRGYRWTETQVNDLLEDIKNFNETDENSWYCLQPLVVKMKNDGSYEVIDGQQRLTTIYLILRFKRQKEQCFTLKYETANNTEVLLEPEKIQDGCSLNEAYIKDAYEVIKNYKYDGNWLDKLLEKTKFIWYEITDDESPINVFRRLNSGKIPLKKAELIKALFLNRSNFKDEFSDTIYLRQLEIANEWDSIESALQNDEFWYFISNENKLDNRIEFIFDILSENNAFKSYFEKYTNDNANFIANEWKEIKKCFHVIEEWFNDHELRNIIGYLQCVNNKEFSIRELYSIKAGNKSEFRTEIKNKLNEYLKKLCGKDSFDDFLRRLTKGDDDDTIRKILLLHNVIYTTNREEFFRFDLYKQTKWDIEHIASVGGDSIPKKKEDIKNWLDVTEKFLSLEQTKMITKIKTFKIDDNPNLEKDFQELFNEVNATYLDGISRDEEEINSLKNLVLLDSTTNRSYKNNIFPIKRKEIINLDKLGIKKDKKEIRYLLPCTRNVFLKYYSDSNTNPNKWGKKDADNYFDTLAQIKDYAGENNG